MRRLHASLARGQASADKVVRHWRIALSFALLVSTSACTQWFFYPNQFVYGVPSDKGYQFDDVWLRSKDGTRLHAWHVYPATEARGIVYFLHGNAQNISAHVNLVLWLVDAGYRVLALDYRGYGKSAGVPDLPEVFDDIHAGVMWIEEALGNSTASEPAYLLGQSLGASLAINYLHIHPQSKPLFNALIVEAAFARYGSIARHVASNNWFTWPFQYPAQWLITDDYDPLDVMPTLSPLPVMILHSPEDSVVPFNNARQLYRAAKDPKTFLEASGPHVQAFADLATRRSVLDFMARYREP